MKIAIIGSKGIPAQSGGIEHHVDQLSQKLAKEGLDVFVYSRPWYSNSNAACHKGVNVVNINSIRTKHLDTISHVFFSTMHALFRDYNIIHYHGVGPALLAFLPRFFKRGVKVVVTFHCIDRKHQKWGGFARAALRLGEWCACHFAHKTITVSRVLQQYCIEAYETQTEYIPNGVESREDTSKKIDASYEQVLGEFKLESNKYFLIVSRLVRHKGIHVAIEAFKKFKAQSDSDFKLVIVGEPSFTDDYATFLRVLVGNDQDIIFTGFRTGADLDTLFKNCYIMVHPSESEGLPIAVLEGMSYGKGVLASDIYENIEALGGFGFLFKNKDAGKLKERMSQLATEKELVLDIGKKAKEHVAKKYCWDDIAKKTIDLYSKLLRDRKLKIMVNKHFEVFSKK